MSSLPSIGLVLAASLALALPAFADTPVGSLVSSEIYALDVVSEASGPTPIRKPLDEYTIERARREIPASLDGVTARLVESAELPVVPASNLIEMEPVWKRAGHTDWLLLGRGSYGLAELERRLGRPDVLERQSDGSYLLRRPLYIAPTGSLVIRDGEWLKLSIEDGVLLLSHGKLVAVGSRITSWSRRLGNRGPRPRLSKQEQRLRSRHVPRPYLLFQNGSRTWIAASELSGLGYMGGFSSYGLSFSATLGRRGLNSHLQRLPRPRGWLIGNRIEDLFFGLYSNRTAELVAVGNDFDRNVVYGIDPHDYSKGVLIARNVARNTLHAHGVILSREVSNAQVVENVAILNAGSGIMLDRACERVLVDENFAVSNSNDGISIFESGDAWVTRNESSLNLRNGILVRNSDDAEIRGNSLARNGVDGVELTARRLNDPSRSARLDPYRVRTTAGVLSNVFDDNANSAVNAKGAAEIALGGNEYVASGPLYFSGDLARQMRALLRGEPRENGRVLQLERRSSAAETGP